MVRPTAKQLTTLYTTYYELSPDQSVNTPMIEDILKRVWATKYHPLGGVMYINRDLKSKAAAQCIEIAQNRPFPAHNVSMSLLSTFSFLSLNSYAVKQTAKTITNLCLLLRRAQNGEDVATEVKAWFKENMVAHSN